MMLSDANGIPVGLHVESASPSEVRLIEPLCKRTVASLPRRTRLLYDKAADSRHLRMRLSLIEDIRLIAPYRRRINQKVARKLPPRDRGHYRIRWRIERTFAWLKNFRRLQVRHEHHSRNYKGFWIIGVMFSILKKL